VASPKLTAKTKAKGAATVKTSHANAGATNIARLRAA
jgi:hypothetical protein